MFGRRFASNQRMVPSKEEKNSKGEAKGNEHESTKKKKDNEKKRSNFFRGTKRRKKARPEVRSQTKKAASARERKKVSQGGKTPIYGTGKATGRSAIKNAILGLKRITKEGIALGTAENGNKGRALVPGSGIPQRGIERGSTLKRGEERF